MKVFISWSGATSHKIANVLRENLPIAIQSLEPYVSSKDIDKGARWSTEISKELEQCQFGILCITGDNLDAPWLLFEAGALAKNIDVGQVTPFLFGVEDEDLPPPLMQFQTTKFVESDVKKLIHSLNKANDSGELHEALLNKSFETMWPTIKESVDAIKLPKPATSSKAGSSSHDQSKLPEILAKMLDLLQRQHRLLSSPEQLVPREYIHSALGRQVLETAILILHTVIHLIILHTLNYPGLGRNSKIMLMVITWMTQCRARLSTIYMVTFAARLNLSLGGAA